MGEVFGVELLPARHGDCLLIRYGPVESPWLVLVDGGPQSSYPALRTRLSALAPERRRLELLLISHIDHDHIGGAVELLGDTTLGLTHGDLWFNGWEQLRQPLQGWRGSQHAVEGSDRSPLEGHHLAFRARRTGAAWNATFGGRAVCIDGSADLPEVQLPGGLRLVLLSPDVSALERLRSHWRKAMERAGSSPDDAAAVERRLRVDRRYRDAGVAAPSVGLMRELADMDSTLDDAVANGSSIAFVAEYAGRRCAFLADAHAPLVEASFRRLALRYGEARLRLDALKVAHHGSRANTTAALLKAVDCPRFLVSTDGSVFGHPDDETIARIVEHAGRPVSIYFNYRNEHTGRWADAGLQASLGFTAMYPASAEEGACLDLLSQT